MLEGYQDKVKESINEGRVHVDDVVALLECHAIGVFHISAIGGVSASIVVGYICNFERKRIVCIRVSLATGIVLIKNYTSLDKIEIKFHVFFS